MAIRDMKAWDSCGMSHIKIEPFMETVVWWLQPAEKTTESNVSRQFSHM